MRLKRVARPTNQPNENKYNNIKTTRIIDGVEVTFDSLLEGKFWDIISENQKSLGIKQIERQREFILHEGYEGTFTDVKRKKLVNPTTRQKREYNIITTKKKVQPIKYVCDFILTMNNGTEHIIDVKGVETPDFKLKKKMFEKLYMKSLICVNSVVINNGRFATWLKNQQNGK